MDPAEIAADPFVGVEHATAPQGLRKPAEIFGEERKNSRGFDLSDEEALAEIEAARDCGLPDAGPVTVRAPSGVARDVINPATGDKIGRVTEADAATVARAIEDAAPWKASAAERAEVLRRAADLYEANFGVIFAALAREAGKFLPDAVGELREAVDFLRYYAGEAENADYEARGVIVAISPWNFPLAIFTGQISAALAAGNAVLSKPAEQTPIISAIAVRLLHEAGVPAAALQLLPGDGGTVGAALTASPDVAGVVFTGSTETAQIVRRAMADHMAPGTPLIAETGGLNAMIVDSTALPEQAVRRCAVFMCRRILRRI